MVGAVQLMMPLFSKIGWPRFRLQSLLLTTMVAATVCDVYLRPKTPVRTMAGALMIETRQYEVKSPHNAEPSTWLEQGAWRIRTRSGKLLALGSHDQGQAMGTWRYFDESGETRAKGECQQGQPVGRWVSFNSDGSIACEATLPLEETTKPADILDFRQTPPTLERQRPSSVSIADAMNRLASSRYHDRCLALHQLVSHGEAALPAMMEVVQQVDHPARRQVIHWLKQVGPEARSLAPALRKIARSDRDPFRNEVRIALLAIDPERENDYLKDLLEDVAIHQAYSATQLHRALDREPEMYARRLGAFVKDERPEVRRLVAGLLLKRFEQIASATISVYPWYTDTFGLGLAASGVDDDAAGDPDNPVRCQEIIEQLKIIQSDSNPEIREVAAKVVTGWDAKQIWAARPYSMSHTGGGYF